MHYLQLAHNYRNPKTGRARAKVLYNSGRTDQVDRAAIERLLGSVRRFLGPADTAQLRTVLEADGLEFVSARALGGCWLLDQLWHRMRSIPRQARA